MSVAIPLDTEPIVAFGPASLSNLGPGFDTLGLCLEGIGDAVDAWLVSEPGIHLVPGVGRVSVATPMDPRRNTAARAASLVFNKADTSKGLLLRIRKGIPLGSGIGGSAASAVAGAWAANLLLGLPFDKEALIEAVLEGEMVASGSRHGDNVLPSLLGGLVLVSPDNPSQCRQIPLPQGLCIAVILPHLEVLTQLARSILPSQVSLHDAIHNAADLAFMLDAFRAGDWEMVGKHMMRDRLVEPVRAGLVPCYETIRSEALEAGAYGCALTGSGPAMFAITETREQAQIVLDAMQTACSDAGIEAGGFVSQVNSQGAAQIDSTS